LATLNRFTAEVIAEALAPLGPDRVLLSGGGAHNPQIVEHLRAALPAVVLGNTDELGMNPDAKEAVLFALLANELVAGDPLVFRDRILGAPAVSMGKISFPT
jgi:anhydro-N-acetylmuramic acid kinase